MVYWLQLTYDEVVDILDNKKIAGWTIGYTLPPGKFEITDNNSMTKSLLLNNVKKNISIDDIRLKSNLTTKKNNTIYSKIFFLYSFRF